MQNHIPSMLILYELEIKAKIEPRALNKQAINEWTELNREKQSNKPNKNQHPTRNKQINKNSHLCSTVAESLF